MYKKIAEKCLVLKETGSIFSLPTIKFATMISLFLTRTASSTGISAHPTTFFYSLFSSKQ